MHRCQALLQCGEMTSALSASARQGKQRENVLFSSYLGHLSTSPRRNRTTTIAAKQLFSPDSSRPRCRARLRTSRICLIRLGDHVARDLINHYLLPHHLRSLRRRRPTGILLNCSFSPTLMMLKDSLRLLHHLPYPRLRFVLLRRFRQHHNVHPRRQLLKMEVLNQLQIIYTHMSLPYPTTPKSL